MKLKTTLLLFVLVGIVLAGVYREGNTPVPTTAIEKSKISKIDGNSNGGIIINVTSEFATYVADMRLAKIHWCKDEWFFVYGYKAKLSDAIDEIIAPPDQRNNRDLPLKVPWQS